LALAWVLTRSVFAAEPLVFDNAADEARFLALATELRCLVCQNQTIADSDAPLAQDLRNEIHDMIVAGRSDEEIKAFMVERYGDFVLYRPPVRSNTIVLWTAPLILLLIGGGIMARAVRRRSAQMEADHDAGQSPGPKDPT
ncbi:MAG: cytochrome c-type biogenesis protein, partial [Xanthomonadales bacterium]|nr:cytochrome c-type biogenesis protein [Xanthomonadales bacterium]